MSVRSLTTRVLRGTVFVALVTALAGAATAALIARELWEAHERSAQRILASGLAGSIAREAAEPGGTLDSAIAEVLQESVPAGQRAEVWRGAVQVASNHSGPALGPPRSMSRATRHAMLVESRTLAEGLVLLVAAPRDRIAVALRILGWSLLLSAPVCVALAIFTGRIVGRRASRPLREFRDRIAAARPFDPFPQGPPSVVTEVSELEASFRGLWERLRQAMAREAEFAANAAHELRTPLTRIRLHAERASAASSPELRDLIAEIDRVVRLVDSLLVLARDTASGIPAGETVNISDVALTAARRVFAGQPPPQLEAPDETLVRGDEALLGIAVENLLDNACKFASPGRAPRVILEGDATEVRLSVMSPGARVRREEAERVFERFYRGPEARAVISGHGLGLPLARHIARLHGGDVRCVSGPDEEARFELSLPAWHPLERDPAVSEERSGVP